MNTNGRNVQTQAAVELHGTGTNDTENKEEHFCLAHPQSRLFLFGLAGGAHMNDCSMLSTHGNLAQ